MEIQPIEFKVDDIKLRGKFYQAVKPGRLAMLFLHGWTGLPNEAAAELMAKNGYTSMTFSYQGHNGMPGDIFTLTRNNFLEDVLSAYDYFKSKLPNDAKIAVVGSSLGSYLGVMLSSEREVAALSIRVPANYKDELFDKAQYNQSGDVSKDVMTWRRKKLTPSSSRAIKNMSVFEGPIQIFEASEDELIPHQTVQNYIDAIKDKKQLEYNLMEGWPHSLGADARRNHQFQQMLLKWAKSIAKEL